ncbi:MAG TPA: SRPBCC domain-containing protein [Gemmatimonadaceae bacterium]|nr:SRPBCC domain-containing protein [Gemmatimonadaceae bacterium]
MADIIHRVGIKASPERVHDAIATAEGVAGWWTRETSGESRVGRTLTVRFRDHGAETEKGRMDLEVVRLDPSEVQWRVQDGPPEWLGTDITFSLARDGDYTILLFGHRNWRDEAEFMAHCSMKWATFLLSLRQLAETGRGAPAPDDLKIDNWN